MEESRGEKRVQKWVWEETQRSDHHSSGFECVHLCLVWRENKERWDSLEIIVATIRIGKGDNFGAQQVW